MEVVETSDLKVSSSTSSEGGGKDKEQLRVKKKTLHAVLEQCQRALESLRDDDDGEEEAGSDDDSTRRGDDFETNELCDIVKSTIQSPYFLEKLGSVHMSSSQIISEEGSSWDMVNDNDLRTIEADIESDQEGYVLVSQDDIVEGIACFMAAYLLSLEQTKELTPNQLQHALSKTFSVKKNKGKLRKAWDGSKIIYNVVSWGATAVGIYQNPVLFRAASLAFWNSCHIISKLL